MIESQQSDELTRIRAANSARRIYRMCEVNFVVNAKRNSPTYYCYSYEMQIIVIYCSMKKLKLTFTWRKIEKIYMYFPIQTISFYSINSDTDLCDWKSLCHWCSLTKLLQLDEAVGTSVELVSALGSVKCVTVLRSIELIPPLWGALKFIPAPLLSECLLKCFLMLAIIQLVL